MEIRRRALEYLYDREAKNPQPRQLTNQIHMPTTAQELGIDQLELGQAFQRLVDGGGANPRPRQATGLRTTDGCAWITQIGQRKVEQWRVRQHRDE